MVKAPGKRVWAADQLRAWIRGRDHAVTTYVLRPARGCRVVLSEAGVGGGHASTIAHSTVSEGSRASFARIKPMSKVTVRVLTWNYIALKLE